MRRGTSNLKSDPVLGNEYNLRQMGMLIEQESVEGRLRKWLEGDDMVNETTSKQVPIRSWLKRWARIWRTL